MKKLFIPILALLGMSVVGCSDVAPSTNVPVVEISEEEQARQAALIPQLDQVARQHLNTAWESLPQDAKAPYLDFHKGDEAKAKDHFGTMVQSHKDSAAAAGTLLNQ
ncbi:MAG: hypothetical protein MH204_04235 [Fimbriimonadaceae bacterium]|nr:hypothetical protein [Fimbriimonadaceae bacterium]